MHLTIFKSPVGRSASAMPATSSRLAATQIFATLRDDIISLKLAPGSVVDRGALQAAFGRSSTPIRDALIRLSEEGLVDIVPQSATRVSLIDVEKAREAQFLRRALELEAVKAICEASDKSVVGLLRQLVDAQKEQASTSNLEQFDDLDRQFHRRIFEAAGVADLYALVRKHSGHIDRIRKLHLPLRGRMQEVVRDHIGIVKALAAGNVPDAQLRVREHLAQSLAYSPILIEAHPKFFRERT